MLTAEWWKSDRSSGGLLCLVCSIWLHFNCFQ